MQCLYTVFPYTYIHIHLAHMFWTYAFYDNNLLYIQWEFTQRLYSRCRCAYRFCYYETTRWRRRRRRLPKVSKVSLNKYMLYAFNSLRSHLKIFGNEFRWHAKMRVFNYIQFSCISNSKIESLLYYTYMQFSRISGRVATPPPSYTLCGYYIPIACVILKYILISVRCIICTLQLKCEMKLCYKAKDIFFLFIKLYIMYWKSFIIVA